jgi:hypothetical protein
MAQFGGFVNYPLLHLRLPGKYTRHHSRLEVQPTSRWFTNQQLEDLLERGDSQDTGLQD